MSPPVFARGLFSAGLLLSLTSDQPEMRVFLADRTNYSKQEQHDKAMMKTCFSIDRIQYGWFNARIMADDTVITINASYFENFVDDLLTALLCAMGKWSHNEANRNAFIEEQETQKAKWEITCQNSCFVFTVITCEVLEEDSELSRCSLVIDKKAFLGDFISEFERILKKDGYEGFKENWYHAFPQSLYARLIEAMGHKFQQVADTKGDILLPENSHLLRSTMRTPFGEVFVFIDGKRASYSVAAKDKEPAYQDVLGCYRISVDFQPDGKEHEIKCIIPEMQCTDRGPESGEGIECQAFYNGRGEKLSICVKCESGKLPDGSTWSKDDDYDAEYLENGMVYMISKNTIESRYIFGIAWIDTVAGEIEGFDRGRDVQTWLAADFTLDTMTQSEADVKR